MYRNRCREKYTDEELREIYAVPHDHTQWPDHVLRVCSTLDLAAELMDDTDHTGADLSCGNAFTINRLPFQKRYLGDYAPGYAYCGPIEETIKEIPEVDVFFCCETLEHLDDPESVLRQIRQKSKKLIVSTPICRWRDDNPEHYWSWDQEAVKAMLVDTGWNPTHYRETYFDPGYCFQIWGCQ